METRLADDLSVAGRTFTADLIAKRATGVRGYKMTLAFIERDGAESHFVDLDPASSRDEAEERAEALRADPGLLEQQLQDALEASD